MLEKRDMSSTCNTGYFHFQDLAEDEIARRNMVRYHIYCCNCIHLNENGVCKLSTNHNESEIPDMEDD